MRTSAFATGLVSVGILLVSFTGISALPDSNEPSKKHNILGENDVEHPDYDFYGEGPANRDDYVTVTYYGYGPPPPPPSSSVAASASSSGFNQSIPGTVASSILSSGLSSGMTTGVPSGALFFSQVCR
ncbi:hypothetical protein F4680DRAFT_404936 [Xylaria scruposa]|nr:hypothetical protein F4680DRAFT_404936 [Xylaria scruposa]